MERARRVFEQAAGSLGIEPERYLPTVLSTRNRAAGTNEVVRFTGPETSFVVKAVIGEPWTAQMRETANFHDEAEKTMRGGRNSAPRIYAITDDPAGVVMEDIEGQTGAQQMQGASAGDCLGALIRAGAWLGEFHSAGPSEIRPLNIGAIKKRASSLHKGVMAHRGDRPEFGEIAQHLCAFLDRLIASGPPMARLAWCHGDFHIGNVILSDQRSVAIDFGLPIPGAVGIDIGQFVFSALTWGNRDLDPAEALAAFADGYGPEALTDASVSVHFELRLLHKWTEALMKTVSGGKVPEGKIRRLRQLLSIFGGARPSGLGTASGA